MPEDGRAAIQLPVPLLGINLLGGNYLQGELEDAVNVLPDGRELRTRGGQLWIASVGPIVIGDVIANGDGDDDFAGGVSAPIGGLGDGDQWTFAAGWKAFAGASNIHQITERFTKAIGFVFDTGTANTTSTLTASYEYKTSDTPTWASITTKEFDLTSGRPVPLSTHMGATKVLVLLDTGSDAAGDDTFFNSQVLDGNFYFRVTLSGTGTITAGCEPDVSVAYNAYRPNALASFSDSLGRKTLVVGHTLPMEQGNTAAVDSPAARRYYEYLQDLSIILPQEVYEKQSPISRGDDDSAYATLRGQWWERSRTTHYVEELRGTVTSTTGVNFGRHKFRNEVVLYVPATDRLLCTTASGVLSAREDEGELDQLTNTTTSNARQFVYETFPPLGSNDRVGFRNTLKLSDIGTPTSIFSFDGRLVALYRGGRVRWSARFPNDDIWADDAFNVVHDDRGADFVGGVGIGNQALLFTQDSMWTLTRDGDLLVGNQTIQAYTVQPLFKGVGAVNQQSIVEAEGAVYWRALDGIYRYRFGESAPTKVSRNVQPLFDTGLSKPGARYGVAAFDRRRRQIWFACIEAGKWKQGLVLVLDLENTSTAPDGVVVPSIWKLKGINAEQLTYDDGDDRLVSVDHYGRVWAQNTGAGDGVDGREGISPQFFTFGSITGNGMESFRPDQVFLYARHFGGTDYQVDMTVDGEEVLGDVITFSREEDAYPLADKTEAEKGWGETGFTFSGTALSKHERRKLRFSRAAGETRDGNDISVKVSVSSPQGGDRIAFLGGEVVGSSIGKR